MKTICICCGAPKRFYNQVCPACSFEPTSEEELAKSRILSEPWSFGLPDGDVFETGRSAEELSKISELLRSGGEYRFSRDELTAMMKVFDEANAITGVDVAWGLAKWFGPPITVLLLVYWFLASAP